MKTNTKKYERVRLKSNCLFSSRCLDFMEPNATMLELIDSLYKDYEDLHRYEFADIVTNRKPSFINFCAEYFEPDFDPYFKSVGYLISAYRLNNNDSSSRP